MVQREFSAADTFVSECLDIEALRRYRLQNGFGRWFKDMRMEQFAPVYRQPVYPKNKYLDAAPTPGWWERDVAILGENIEHLKRAGVLVPPSEEEVAAGTDHSDQRQG
jgi:hypothetical protein